MNKTLYVVGFAFSADGSMITLIKKRKPTWQAGKLNGVGGKVEFGETGLQAMIREFKEETTVETAEADWRQFATLHSKDWIVDAFCAFNDKFLECRTNTPEQIVYTQTDLARPELYPMVPNLAWLIPMALQSKDDVSFAQATVQYLSVSDVE